MTFTVAVHGATGTQGGHIAARLRAAGHRVRPLNSTVDIVDAKALAEAYGGVDAVVVALPQVFSPVTLDHAAAVLDALGLASVPRAVFNPGLPLPADEIGLPFVDARVRVAERLADRVPFAAVLGPAGPYLENLRQSWAVDRVVGRQEVAYPLPGDLPMPWNTLDDLGDLIATTLASAESPARRMLTGPRPVTGDDLAAAVGAAAGCPVRFVPIELDEFRRLLATVVGPETAAGIAAMYAAGPGAPPAGETVAGPTSVTEWAARYDWPASAAAAH
jgi:uncharacterized protein YbjT (DUF2867 family)